MALSNIEWTTYTFNPWRGCTKVSDGCKNCYAETLSKRNPKVLGEWGPNGTRVVAIESYWKQPLRWNEEAKAVGERRRVFCASLADVFEDRPELHAPRERLFELIDSTPDLDWLLLTKRPQNIKKLWPSFGWYDDQFRWPNIWIGTSVENQEQANKRIPELLKVPAAIRFLSCEPLLGRVELSNLSGWETRDAVKWLGKPILTPPGGDGIHWVIVGGESGSGARPLHPFWALSLRDQCNAAGVNFFFKQWGEFVCARQVPLEIMNDVASCPGAVLHNIERGSQTVVYRAGKKAAGRLLDGREWNEVPEVVGVAR